MTQQEFNTRRARIVRRWTAYRVGRAQREIWKRRRGDAGEESFDESGVANDVLAELPDSLLG